MITVDANTENTGLMDVETAPKPIEKVSIIVSKGSLEGVYPGLIMANGARMGRYGSNIILHIFWPGSCNRQANG